VRQQIQCEEKANVRQVHPGLRSSARYLFSSSNLKVVCRIFVMYSGNVEQSDWFCLKLD
jgi:hypothetical protein